MLNATPSAQQQAKFYQGNPAPLQQKVQQAGTNPQGIPNDLQGAIALEQVLKGIQAKQNQQALMAGGNMPTVVDSIRMNLAKTLAGAAAPAAPQAAPQEAPQGIAGLAQAQGEGPGIDQLQSNIQGMAGGGIVAFSGDEGSYVMSDAKGDPYTHLWHAAESGDTDTPYGESVANAVEFPIEMLKRLIGAPNQKKYPGERGIFTGSGRTAPHEVSAAARADDRTRRTPALYRDGETPALSPETIMALGGTRTSSGSTYVPVRSSGLEDALEADLIARLKEDPAALADARNAKNREMSGIDAITAERQKRIDATEALNRETEGHYDPFRNAMEGILNRDRRVGGLGMIMGAAGQGYYAGQDEQDKARKANLAAVNKMYDDMLKAKADGNMELVKVREQELAAFLRQHESAESTTGALLGVREQAAARRQAAAERAQDRKTENLYKVQAALETAVDKDPRIVHARAAAEDKMLFGSKKAAAVDEFNRIYSSVYAEKLAAFRRFGAVPDGAPAKAAALPAGVIVKKVGN